MSRCVVLWESPHPLWSGPVKWNGIYMNTQSAVNALESFIAFSCSCVTDFLCKLIIKEKIFPRISLWRQNHDIEIEYVMASVIVLRVFLIFFFIHF